MSRTGRGLWKPIFAAAGTALAVAALGGWMTDLGPWYYGLRMPSWKPPDWLFGPAWTLIYSLAAIAGVLAWRGAQTMRGKALVLALFALNINLNILWSGLFFRQQRPDYALVEVVFLWLSIVALSVGVWRYSKTASLLLVPYLVWVTFAGALNAAVVRLNAPFGGP